MKTYLKSFALPTERVEYEYILEHLRNATNFHPFNAFTHKRQDYDHAITFEFEPLTFFLWY
ncbi:hypothetical protein LU293_07785 [Moraxella nasovis]|uniref:hypothetical protein n=1 Tax=Moraxella nasovis TaxID=2904121 RepID=UPI001F612CA5|nr:hypothetical protein [Moraxella nasovis]UNU72977.1 hypothetical protein LU293_07785 [Moraxella nasovis]